jgi:RimJ/RimL family protein N-acetyltransferase
VSAEGYGGAMIERIRLRDVEQGDLPELFEHQRDPVAYEMAAFPPRERDAFMAHWAKIIADDRVTKRCILVGAEVAGHVVCFERSGRLLVGYWLGRRFWSRGIASVALAEFVSLIPARPLHAFVAKQNGASIRVLEKCGFERTGESSLDAGTGGEAVEEFVYSLEAPGPLCADDPRSRRPVNER